MKQEESNDINMGVTRPTSLSTDSNIKVLPYKFPLQYLFS